MQLAQLVEYRAGSCWAGLGWPNAQSKLATCGQVDYTCAVHMAVHVGKTCQDNMLHCSALARRHAAVPVKYG